MRTYTTCAGCGDYLLFLGRRNDTHGMCHAPPDYAEQIEKEFLDAAATGDDQRADQLEKTLTHMDTAPPRLLDAALIYADWGWPVFPLKPGAKTPATRHGFKEATTNPAVIRAWWKRMPRANIGVPTGITFDVLDVDFKNGAARIWPDLRDSDAMPNAHGIAVTVSSGLHVLLLPAGGGNAAKLGKIDGLDYRGRGGYIVVAPSVLDDGRRYAWWVKPSPMVKPAVAEATA